MFLCVCYELLCSSQSSLVVLISTYVVSHTQQVASDPTLAMACTYQAEEVYQLHA